MESQRFDRRPPANWRNSVSVALDEVGTHSAEIPQKGKPDSLPFFVYRARI